MTIGPDLTLLRAFTDIVYNRIEDAVQISRGKMLFTGDEFFRYIVTALKTRVVRVRALCGAPTPGYRLRTDSEWFIPATVANLINSVGVWEEVLPSVRYVPVLSPEIDEYVMSFEEQVDMTSRLRVVKDYVGTLITFVSAMEKNVTGDQHVMTIVPIRDQEGRLLQIRSSYRYDAVAAVAAYLLSLVSSVSPSGELDLNTKLRTPYYTDQASLQEWIHILANKVAS